MCKRLFSLLLLVSFGFYTYKALCLPKNAINFKALLVQQDKPTQELLALLQELNIVSECSLDSVVNVTQQAWLRKAGTERWEMSNTLQAKEAVLTPLLKKFVLLQEVSPVNKYYDTLVFMGAAYQGLSARLHYAITMWNQGVRFGRILFILGYRKLDPIVESTAILASSCINGLTMVDGWSMPEKAPELETEKARFLVRKVELPSGMKQLPVVFIDTPCSNAAVRSTTADTVAYWLTQEHLEGTYCIVSCQPHCGYFDATMRLLLPKNVRYEVVGAAVENNKNFNVVLDALARWLYQERAIYNKNKIIIR